MGDRLFSLIELTFSGAVVLGFGIWQLVSINREIARDKAKAAEKEAAAAQAVPAASPEDAGHPVG